jgi:cobalt-zinc-cadmium efflux system membrane fusion protein
MTRWTWAATAIAALLSAGCSDDAAHREEEHHHDEHGGHAEHGHGEAEHAEETARGPRGGRMFTDEGIALELRIVEEDGPPEFVAHLYDGAGKSLPPGDATLSVTLERFAGRREVIAFRPMGEHLRGEAVVGEPHSFVAHIRLERGAELHEWTYEQVEGRLELSTDAVASGGIETAIAGPRSMRVQVQAPAEIRLNGERLVLVRPQYPGIVTKLRVRLGNDVAPGDTLALIRSSESLTEYAVVASARGTIVSQNVAEGSVVDRETVLCTMADLSSVWVEFAIYPQHVGRVRQGQRARIVATSPGAIDAEETVSYVGPLLEQDTRSSYGRIVLPNGGGRWQPGLYVTVHITVDEADVPVAIPQSALVRSQFGPAVFVADGTVFELQPVELGRSDGEFVEVVSGVPDGTRIVVRNAFVLKAELGKSEATHEH